MNYKYAVVIVTYNRLSLLKECLSNALSQTYRFENIYVVNNNSNDGTLEYLSEIDKDYDNVHVYNLEKNIGGAGGFNFGLNQVKDDDFVLLIDDDAIIEKDYIERINEEIEEKYLAYSGTVLKEGNIDVSHRRYLVNDVFMSDADVPLDQYNNNSFIYDISSFCGLIVSVPLVKKIGLPREDFFIWYDDSEYSMRLKTYTRIKNVNAAQINHKTKDAFINGLSWKTYYGFRNYLEVGRIYSKNLFLFKCKRYFYHFEGTVYYWIKSLFCKDRGYYYKNCCLLHRTVMKDFKKHRMGISEIFKPGVNLEEKIVE